MFAFVSEIVAMLNPQTGHKLKRFRSDGGSEYDNALFRNWFVSTGDQIAACYTAPKQCCLFRQSIGYFTPKNNRFHYLQKIIFASKYPVQSTEALLQSLVTGMAHRCGSVAHGE